MRFRDTLSHRRLISAILYLCSAVFFMSNLIYLGTAGFDAIDLFLIVAGWTTWTLAGIQSVYGRSVALRQVSTESEEPPLVRQSTHSIVNASLYSASAVFFIAGDAYNASTPLAIRASRLTGSSLWLISSLTYLWLAYAHERRQEDNPDRDIRPAGISANIFHFACESEYLASGILYAAAIWLTNPVQALKAAGNVCWLLASTHESIRTFQALPSRDTEVDLEMGEVPTAPAPK